MPLPPRNERFSPESQMQPPPGSPKHDLIDIPSLSSSSSSADDNFSSPPSSSMKPIVFPPGYRFVPTDKELILHYLKPFLQGNKNSSPNIPIHRVNVYESNPEQLSKEFKRGNAKEWFFITERTKVSKGGKNQNRSNNGGYWKILAAAKKIEAGQGLVGYKRKLDYHMRNKSNGVKTDWLMHEYWVETSNGDNNKVDHALCKIYLTAKGYKRRSEEEENEKKKIKIEGAVATEEEVYQPCNVAFQQPQVCLLPLEPQAEQKQQFPEKINFQQQPVIPDDDDAAAHYLGDFNPHLLDGDEESKKSGYLEDILR